MVRCELDGVMNYKGQEQLLLIKALNEFDPKFSGKQPHCAAKTEAKIDRKHPCPWITQMSDQKDRSNLESKIERVCLEVCDLFWWPA